MNRRNPEHPRHLSRERAETIRHLQPGWYRPNERFYLREEVKAIVRPRRWLGNEWERKVAGTRIIRIDNEAERIPRARQMEPGVSGKSFRRKFKKELREERANNKGSVSTAG